MAADGVATTLITMVYAQLGQIMHILTKLGK